MLARRLISLFKSSPSSPKPLSGAKGADDGKSGSVRRKAVSFLLITVTGGVALSALDDLSIYYGCSRQAMEKAGKNQAVRGALGEPIVKGPWYNASLAVSHKRQSVSCTFPVSGPNGNGVFQLKAIRKEGDDNWFSFILPRDWEILVMEALLHLPGNEEKQQTLRITVSDETPCQACTACPRPQPQENPEKK